MKDDGYKQIKSDIGGLFGRLSNLEILLGEMARMMDSYHITQGEFIQRFESNEKEIDAIKNKLSIEKEGAYAAKLSTAGQGEDRSARRDRNGCEGDRLD